MKQYLFWLQLFFISIANAQTSALWIRYPSISPDGSEIVFSYKGDLWKTNIKSKQTLPLTFDDGYETRPIWSPDGRWIAFSSNLNGNLDVFVIPASGGVAKQLTFHSSDDKPWCFTADSKYILFGTLRNDIANSVAYPAINIFNRLYKVPVSGGKSVMLSAIGMSEATTNILNTKIFFEDTKGYENQFRKHHNSSVAKNIWYWDTKSNSYVQVTDNEYEDRNPVLSADEKDIFYLSERKNNSMNIYKRSLLDNSEERLTNFDSHPVRHLTRSAKDDLCFTYNGEVYIKAKGKVPNKIPIHIPEGLRLDNQRVISFSSGGTGYTVSPTGKEVGFIYRGDIYTAALDGGGTKQITNTPQQERDISFSPDGRKVYYASERNGSWDIYSTEIVRLNEKSFINSTLLQEKNVIHSEEDEFQPRISPDGKKLAYLENRNELKTFEFLTGKKNTLIKKGENLSYTDGDQFYVWSPDSEWIIARSSKGRFITNTELVLLKSDGTTKAIDLTHSGFSDISPQWSFNGKGIIWATDRDGKKSFATQGAKQYDLYALFLDRTTAERFRMGPEGWLLTNGKSDSIKSHINGFDTEYADQSKMRLTNNSADITSYVISSGADKIIFTARYEQGTDIFLLNPRTRETRSLIKLNAGSASLIATNDAKNIIVVHDGRISKLDIDNARMTPIPIQGEFILDSEKEKEYILEHTYQLIQKKFYDPKLHGVDWLSYKKAYSRFLPHINNNYDFVEMLSEMTGELNVSHTGARFNSSTLIRNPTASLGLLFDEQKEGKGLTILDIVENGPIDRSGSRIKNGHILESIDGQLIDQHTDWNRSLAGKAGKYILLQLRDPITNESWEEVVRPITLNQENDLLYKRWVNKMRKIVDSISNGELGYVHIPVMNDGSYRTFYEEVMGLEADKKGLIVDTRFNGGGNLHEDLSEFLNGKKYISFESYGIRHSSYEPVNKWVKPSILLMSEANYSDAHTFPYAYRKKGIGQLIGMPVAGTSTSIWFETQIDPTVAVAVPTIAFFDLNTNRPLENVQLEPDIKVQNKFENLLRGKDEQLETAIRELTLQIKNNNK